MLYTYILYTIYIYIYIIHICIDMSVYICIYMCIILILFNLIQQVKRETLNDGWLQGVWSHLLEYISIRARALDGATG